MMTPFACRLLILWTFDPRWQHVAKLRELSGSPALCLPTLHF
jgi:hypothetical protein